MGIEHEHTPNGATLWGSFGHAWDGLVDAAVGQRNMRIHLVAGVLAGSFAAVAPLSPAERGLIVLCAALVTSAEAANTALEALVDLHGGPRSELGRIAKDAAAGAVLILAGASVALFAIVAWGHSRDLARDWRTLVTPGVISLGLGVTTALLVMSAGPLARAATPLAVVGVILLTGLCATAAHGALAAVPACFLAIAAAASRRDANRVGR